jgi:mRNA interferase RelE/StbE
MKWSVSLAWQIEFTKSAQKQLSKIDRTQAKRILDYLRTRIGDDPRSTGKVLTGALGEFWRYRVGDFRIICEIDDKIVRILVLEIGHRGEIYR